jgi:hypothetical protein
MQNDIKPFPTRLPKELWKFLKNKSTEKEMSMNDIIIALIIKYKKSLEKSLTKSDIEI